MTRVRAPALDYHFLDSWTPQRLLRLGMSIGAKGRPLPDWPGGSNTSVTVSRNVAASNPSTLKPVSSDITSASALLCDTAVCFSHAHEIGTKI